MAKIDELRARWEAASARVDTAAASGDAEAELRAIEDEEAAAAELQTEQGRARKLTGKRQERAAKKASGGRYQVAFYDVAAGLTQLDPAIFPNGGIVVLRSAEQSVRKRHEAAMQDGSGVDASEANITLIVESTVEPKYKVDDPAALAYREFWEGPGRGLVGLVALEISRLGGFQLDAFKRATK